MLHTGAVMRGDDYLNLNRPGVVRALLDEALSRGWRASAPGRGEFDGWVMIDAVLNRLRTTESVTAAQPGPAHTDLPRVGR